MLFEKILSVNKNMAESDYKKYITYPPLNPNYGFVNINYTSKEEGIKKQVADNLLNYLEIEINGSLMLLGMKTPQVEQLYPEKYDSSSIPPCQVFRTLSKYANRYNTADQKRDNIIRAETKTTESEKEI